MIGSSPVQVNISTLTIVKVLLVVLGLVFLWAIRDIVAIVIIAWVLASALHPWVDRLQRHHIPRALGILSVYVVVIGAFVGIVVLLVPPLSHELASIATNFPAYYQAVQRELINAQTTTEQVGLLASIREGLDTAVKNLTNIGAGLYSAVASLFGGVATTIAVLVIAFYMTVEQDGIKKFIQAITPVPYQPYVIHKLNQIQTKLSNWLWGQVVLMCFVGVLVGIAMWIIGVKYALVLGILAGLTEFIPIVGPVVASVPAIFFALTDFVGAPYKVFFVVIIFIVIQQVENQFLVPRVMHRAVGLNPIIVLIGLLIGAKLAGLVGMILAVPVITILSTFFEDFLAQQQREQNRLEQ